MADDPGNRLLATLGSEDFRWLESQLERVDLPKGKVLAEEGEALRETYFPHGSVVSLVRSIERASNTHPGIQDMMLRYTEMLMVLTLQSVACNAAHSIEARACRWICATCDRVGRDDIPLTHEMLAMMLGVQRSSMSVVIHALQSRGLIRQGRGHITIVDRPRLQQTACECYCILRERYLQLLPLA